MTLYNYRLGTTLDIGQLLSYSGNIKKKESNKPNTLFFITVTNTALVLNDEVKYYDPDNNLRFAGYIQNIQDNNGVQTIEVADYSIDCVYYFEP